MKFYSAPENHTYAVNPAWSGSAFVSFHGSWNANPPTGYGVVRCALYAVLYVASIDDNISLGFLGLHLIIDLKLLQLLEMDIPLL